MLSGRGMGEAELFVHDDTGSSTVEFVVMLPFILAMVGVAGGYAETVSQREMLESATWDAARLLSRAPAPQPYTVTDANGKKVPDPYPFFKAEAAAIIASRMSIRADDVVVSVQVSEVAQGVATPYKFYLMDVSTQAKFKSPMIKLTSLFGLVPSTDDGSYVMDAKASVRYLFEAERPTPCTPAQQTQGLCS